MDSAADTMELDSTRVSSEELLSNLMAALASGARAVQGLPTGDDFEYQASFPEFQSLLKENHEDLLEAIILGLGAKDEQSDVSIGGFQGLSDPLLWETCGDVCEWLLEQAEVESAGPKIQNDLVAATNQARASFGRLMQGLVHMDKPQNVYNFYGRSGGALSDLNSREKPFIPRIVEKFHATEPLDLSPKAGHGLEDRFGEWRARKNLTPNSIIAPSHHVPHVYTKEINCLTFVDRHLSAPTSKPERMVPSHSPLQATMVDTKERLENLQSHLETATEIAVDLEAHSFHSFAGITCLIQITIGPNVANPNPANFLVDPFPLWQDLGNALGPAFSNPGIVKVMHGAESDVQWLQRDFGIYVVNLFDTYCASKALSLQRLSYAHLLQTYVGITPDKSHQLSDWRQRPLPPAMKEYAIMDTHYLLGIYERLKYDLEQHKSASVEYVFDQSRHVSLIRYAPEPFRIEGYRALMKRRGSKTELNKTQENVLRELWDWRDQIARQSDESLFSVCSNNALVRLALACPTTLSVLQGLLQPMPPLILRNAKQVLGLVQRCINPPFFKPAINDEIEETSQDDTRGMMSPVLGTEALYRQAGWISPYTDDKGISAVDSDIVTTTDDVEDQELKPRRVLEVHAANQNYRSSQFSSHSLQLGQDGKDGLKLINGMGSVRAVHSSDIDVEVQVAQTVADNIRNAQEKHTMLGLVSPTIDMDDIHVDEDDDGDVAEKPDEEQFVIPRSMREIYRISNRNRRNKKSSSPLPVELDEKEAIELIKAEEVLKSRAMEGKNYFEDIPGTPKRQRTKSTGTASLSSEEAGTGNDSTMSREEDIAMMQEVGWIKDKDEVKSMLKQRDSSVERDDEDAASSEDEGTKPHKAFDYSSVGAIGAFSATPSANPFFSGAATTGGHLNQQFGKTDTKKKQTVARGKQSRRQQQQQQQQQIERPEKTQGRAQAYKKR